MVFRPAQRTPFFTVSGAVIPTVLLNHRKRTILLPKALQKLTVFIWRVTAQHSGCSCRWSPRRFCQCHPVQHTFNGGYPYLFPQPARGALLACGHSGVPCKARYRSVALRQSAGSAPLCISRGIGHQNRPARARRGSPLTSCRHLPIYFSLIRHAQQRFDRTVLLRSASRSSISAAHSAPG